VHREVIGHEIGSLPGASADGPASSEALVDALGMAFSTFTLYEDPRSLEAYGRALDTLRRAPHYPWRAEVGVDGFALNGEPVAVRRDGSLRFSRGLFALGIAAMDLTSPPTGDDLFGLLQLLGASEPPEDAAGALTDAGVRSIRLLDRAMLLAGEGDDESADEKPATTTVAVADDSPAAFILRMMEEGDNAPRTVASRFVEEYERAHLLVDIDDTWGIEELIHAFVDGFWYLPEAHRAEIFSLMLERGARTENTAFLDQFGGTELAQMNQMFGSDGHPLIAEYLRVAAEEGGRHGDGLGDLVAGGHTQSLPTRIVDQVASVLRARAAEGSTRSETAIDRLANNRPSEDEGRTSIANVLRGLLSLAHTNGTFESTAQVWASRVTAALAADDLRAADDWINAVAGLNIDEISRATLLRSLAASVTAPAVDTLARLMTGPAPDGPGSTARKAAPLIAADGLIRELGEEAKASRRKSLLKALQVLARLRPQSLLPHLTDPRWFVVRNVVIALGTSRRSDMAAHVEPLASHTEYRIRIEALRALYRLVAGTCGDVLLEHIGDDHAAVAEEAGRLLGGVDGPDIDRRLAGRIASDDPDEAMAAVAALGWRTTVEASNHLQRMAHKRFTWGRTRSLRAAARQALEVRS